MRYTVQQMKYKMIKQLLITNYSHKLLHNCISLHVPTYDFSDQRARINKYGCRSLYFY